jgi:succinoglycan biosynthesis transport protein ExoP
MDKQSPVEQWDDAQPTLDLRDMLLRLWGYKYLLLAVMIVVPAAAWIYLQSVPERYTATAAILIDPPESMIIDFEEVVEGVSSKPQAIRTEIAVLSSRELAEKVIEKLVPSATNSQPVTSKSKGLFSHLNPLNYLPAEWLAGLRDYWRGLKASLFGDTPTVPLSPEDREAKRQNTRINAFLSGLDVEQQSFTRIVEVSYTARSPAYAAKAANALADTYVRNTLEIKYAGTRDAVLWLGEQLEELRQKVEVSEAATERLRQGDALIQGRSATVVSEQISALNAQLIDAQAESARLRARLRQIEELRGSPDWEEQTTAAVSSEMIQALRLEQFRLEREAAELATEYGDKHPKMINVHVEIADVRDRVRREIDNLVISARNELEAARARQSTIQARLNNLTNEVGTLNEAEMRLRALDREAEANRTLYEAFLTRFKETSVQEEVQQPDARVISYAQIPNVPSFPPKQKILLGSVFLAMGLGLALVIAIEMLDNGFRTSEQLAQHLGLPILALIPTTAAKRKIKSPADYVIKQPYGMYTEAISSLFVHVKGKRSAEEGQAVLVSSGLPKEGKTATAASLARRAALFGDKVLLLDCDFRRPRLHEELGLNFSPGLSQVLKGEMLLEEALQEDVPTGLKVLSCGGLIKDAAALVRSEVFADFLTELKLRFDIVIIDSSPVLAVVEPQILSGLMDKVILLVRWGKTPKKAASAAARQLQDLGIEIDGVVMTQIDLKKQGYYGYGEYGYYSSQMKGYYTS